jgi:GNAT superfamily N-acetyltransferase
MKGCSVKIVPMDNTFILYRCLHAGLLSAANIEQMSTNVPGLPREQTRLNERFLRRLNDVYGSCAMLAMEGEYVVGYARFYPTVIYDLASREHICCQGSQFWPTAEMVGMAMPRFEDLEGRTLRISCWFIHGDYRNRGLSHRLLQGIIEWADVHGWAMVRASAAFNDHWIASQACTLMLRTYEKHGFHKIKTDIAPELEDYLAQMQEGRFGDAKQRAFEEHCGGKDLSMIAVNHTVERKLT